MPWPRHVEQVAAIWKPLWMTYARVPVPLHDGHVDLFAPDFRPLPEQDLQLTTGVTVTVLVVPLQASKKVMSIETPISSPR